jgi:hypothetical protein
MRQVPPLWMVREFCQDAAGYMAGAAGRTIAVHCKAGRGRTGLMVCAFLLTAVCLRIRVNSGSGHLWGLRLDRFWVGMGEGWVRVGVRTGLTAPAHTYLLH